MEKIWIAYRRFGGTDNPIGWAYSAAEAFMKMKTIIKMDKPDEVAEFETSFRQSSGLFWSKSYGAREVSNALEMVQI